jgi:toxin HigB-1
MIKSFKNKETEKIFKSIRSNKIPPDIYKRAFIKLHSIDVANDIIDLKDPPSNNLEVLKGTRKGLCSIRINDQWRICFKWNDNNAYDVEIVDYH